MKTMKLFVLLVLPLAAWAADPKVGDTLADVRASLGAPRGEVRRGDEALLYFDRGDVILKNGVVQSVSLVSEEDYIAAAARREAIAERVRAQTASLVAAGEAIKARQLASEAFQSAPASYQVAFWQDFARRYPTVNCSEELALARMKLDAEEATRVAEENRRAEAAARAAALAAAEAERRYVSFAGYDYPVYPDYYDRYYRRRHAADDLDARDRPSYVAPQKRSYQNDTPWATPFLDIGFGPKLNAGPAAPARPLNVLKPNPGNDASDNLYNVSNARRRF